MSKQLTRITIAGLKRQRRQITLEVPQFLALEGPNGSGKSLVLAAVRLAVLGYEPSLGKTLAATRQLLSHGAAEIDITLTFADGFVVRRKLGAATETSVHPLKTERTEREMQTRVDRELGTFIVSFDLAAFLGLSAEKRREFLLKLLPRDRTLLDQATWRHWLGYADADQKIQAGIDWLWKEKVETSTTLLDGLATALEETTKQVNVAEVLKREQEAIAARASSDAEASAAVQYDASRLTELQAALSVTEQRIGELQAVAERAERAGAELRQREHQARVLTMRIHETGERIQRIERDLAAIVVDTDAIALAEQHADRATKKARAQVDAVQYAAERVAAAEARAAALAARANGLRGRDACPLCGSHATIPEIQRVIADLKAEVDDAVVEAHALLSTARLRKAELDDDANAAGRVLAALRWDRDNAALLTTRLADAKLQRVAAETEQAEFLALPPIEVSYIDREELANLRDQAHRTRAAIKAENELAVVFGRASADRERADKERQALEVQVQRVERLKLLQAAQKKLRAHVIEQLVQPVEVAANTLLQTVDPKKQFKFLFEREESLTFDFGFIEDGVFRSYDAASTGEDAFLAVVLVAALVEVVQPAFRLIQLDNVEHIDDERRRWLMLALVQHRDLFDNVMIAGCSKFADVEGWTVLDPRKLAERRPAGAAA